MMMYGFDPIYMLFVAPAFLLALWAQWRVHSAYRAASQQATASRLSGAETAHMILERNGLHDVSIEVAAGTLSDHYDPRNKVLRLSGEVFHGRSQASVGIAAHEVGHALQDAFSYGPMRLRGLLVPAAATGGQLSMLFIVLGFVLMSGGMLIGKSVLFVGIGLFSLTVLFQLVNLPVEFDASRRAKLALAEYGVVSPREMPGVRRVLGAAALTYVAATLTGILQLLYFLYRAGLLGERRER